MTGIFNLKLKQLRPAKTILAGMKNENQKDLCKKARCESDIFSDSLSEDYSSGTEK